jgi:uncharacterized surface protein with fasciclin (FAS1) repeats
MGTLKRAGLVVLAVAMANFLIGGVYTAPSSVSGASPGASSNDDIVDNMVHISAQSVEQNISLNTIVKAINASGLAGTLKGSGPFTFFAPNDAAFAKLPAGAWDAVMNDQAKLQQFLMNLVVKGAVSRDDLSNGKKLTTLGGATLVPSTRPTLSINAGKTNSPIVRGPDQAKNGVIYIIGSVPGF